MDLCKNLSLTIIRDDEGQVRIKLSNDLEMIEIEVCQQINVTTPQSRAYHIREAVVIAMRRAVCDAFELGLISDSPGAWMTPKPIIKEPSSTGSEIELEL